MIAGAAVAGRLFESKKLTDLTIALLAVAASITSILNGFALDDVAIIVDNEALHSLRNPFALLLDPYWPAAYGQSLYRPLTSMAFAAQWALGGGSPLPFHVVSILLYAAVSVSVYRLAGKFVNDRAALAGGIIFAVHPLHVEAVANVVGQAELWSALFVVFATSIYISRREEESRGFFIAAIAGLFLSALMFKESSIVLPGLIVAAELILPSTASRSLRLRRCGETLLALIAVAAVFLIVRTSVLGQFTGGGTATVLAGQAYSTRFFTMLAVVPEWLRLFAWPASLSADYSPPRIATAHGFEPTMIPALVVVVAVAVIAARTRRKHAGAVFALAVAGIALLIPSNLFVVTGFALAERTLFLASIGIAIVLGHTIVVLSTAKRLNSTGFFMGCLSILAVAGIARSATRAPVWKNNEALFRQTVQDVPLSYRAHMRLGVLLAEKGETEDALRELAIAVSLSRPQDYYVRWLAADRFHAEGQLDIAVGYYREALELKPRDASVRYGAVMALAGLGRDVEARAMAAEGLQHDPGDKRFARIVHTVDSLAAVTPGA